MDTAAAIGRAAEAIGRAKALIVTSGAGMGVDSGLPDFRGEKGFWKAYPMYERLGISFVGAAIPTIRHLSERLGRRGGVTVVRINPREPWIDQPHLSIPDGALSALRAIDTFICRTTPGRS